MTEEQKELPLGLSMSLAMHREALDTFSRLPKGEQDKLIEQSRHVKSKDEMEQLVNTLLPKS